MNKNILIQLANFVNKVYNEQNQGPISAEIDGCLSVAIVTEGYGGKWDLKDFNQVRIIPGKTDSINDLINYFLNLVSKNLNDTHVKNILSLIGEKEDSTTVTFSSGETVGVGHYYKFKYKLSSVNIQSLINYIFEQELIKDELKNKNFNNFKEIIDHYKNTSSDSTNEKIETILHKNLNNKSAYNLSPTIN